MPESAHAAATEDHSEESCGRRKSEPTQICFFFLVCPAFTRRAPIGMPGFLEPGPRAQSGKGPRNARQAHGVKILSIRNQGPAIGQNSAPSTCGWCCSIKTCQKWRLKWRQRSRRIPQRAEPKQKANQALHGDWANIGPTRNIFVKKGLVPVASHPEGSPRFLGPKLPSGWMVVGSPAPNVGPSQSERLFHLLKPPEKT